jgi:hypothetical protein
MSTKRVVGHVSGAPVGFWFSVCWQLHLSGVHRPPQAGISGSHHERFGIAPASVSMHATMNPLFVTANGTVRLRTYAEPYEPGTALTEPTNCFLVAGCWALRLLVDHDVLRGSGRSIPEEFAIYVGLQPFGTAGIPGPERHVHGRWAQYPAIDSTRLNVLNKDLAEGDAVFLGFGAGEAFGFIGVPQAPRQ